MPIVQKKSQCVMTESCGSDYIVVFYIVRDVNWKPNCEYFETVNVYF